jgi:hypothetical protein
VTGPSITGAAGPTGPLGATGPSVPQSPWLSLITAANNSLVDTQTITFHGEFQNGTFGATGLIDWRVAQKQAVTLQGATTVISFTGPLGVGNFLLRTVSGATGPHTPVWPTTVKWVGGTPPTLTPTAAAVDIASFYWNATNFYGSYGLGFA